MLILHSFNILMPPHFFFLVVPFSMYGPCCNYMAFLKLSFLSKIDDFFLSVGKYFQCTVHVTILVNLPKIELECHILIRGQLFIFANNNLLDTCNKKPSHLSYKMYILTFHFSRGSMDSPIYLNITNLYSF